MKKVLKLNFKHIKSAKKCNENQDLNSNIYLIGLEPIFCKSNVLNLLLFISN
jgi:hypothetical protein